MMARVSTHWTEYEDATLVRMLGDGAMPTEIGRTLNRTRGSVEIHIHRLRVQGRLPQGRHNGAPEPSPEQRREAERAYAAPRSTTAAFCGDPPLGRSSLDRRRA